MPPQIARGNLSHPFTFQSGAPEGRLGCCAGGDCGDGVTLVSLGATMSESESTQDAKPQAGAPPVDLSQEFFARALVEQLDPEDVFRITITSFLDPYNFDVRRVMKCCVHNILPSGHVVPFCAYNTLYRNGIVPLPELTAIRR